MAEGGGREAEVNFCSPEVINKIVYTSRFVRVILVGQSRAQERVKKLIWKLGGGRGGKPFAIHN